MAGEGAPGAPRSLRASRLACAEGTSTPIYPIRSSGKLHRPPGRSPVHSDGLRYVGLTVADNREVNSTETQSRCSAQGCQAIEVIHFEAAFR